MSLGMFLGSTNLFAYHFFCEFSLVLFSLGGADQESEAQISGGPANQ